MATIAVYMKSIFISNYEEVRSNKSFEYSEQIIHGSANTGNAVIIPANAKKIWASIITSGGSGSVQLTTDPIANVIASPDSCNWFTWSLGTVSASAILDVSGVTAVRQVNATNTTIMNVRTSS